MKFNFQSCSSLFFFNDQKIWREIQNFWRCLLSWTQLRFSVSWSGENRYERKSSSIINKIICLNYKTGFRLIQKIAPLKIEFELSKTVSNYCNKKYCENIKYFINLPNIFRLSLPFFTFSFSSTNNKKRLLGKAVWLYFVSGPFQCYSQSHLLKPIPGAFLWSISCRFSAFLFIVYTSLWQEFQVFGWSFLKRFIFQSDGPRYFLGEGEASLYWKSSELRSQFATILCCQTSEKNTLKRCTYCSFQMQPSLTKCFWITNRSEYGNV